MTASAIGRKPVPMWSDEVVRAEVRGHSCLVYSDRPHSVNDAVRAARRWQEREFLTHGERRISFGSHERAVRRIAAKLRAASVGPGDRVAIFAANSPEWIAVFYASMWVGAIAVPCNGWWSQSEMAHACAAVSPVLVVADERRKSMVPDGVDTLNIADLGEAFSDAGQLPECDPAEIDEDAPALILFTSGTTGAPKGATLSHRALCTTLQNLLVVSNRLPTQLGEDHDPSVTLVCLPLFHIGAIQLALIPLATGSRLIFLAGRFDPRLISRTIDDERVTMMSAVPTMMERLLPVAAESSQEASTLRTIVLGGAPVSESLLNRVGEVYPNARRRIGQSYGLTEACGVISSGVSATLARHPGSVGRIMPVVEVYCGGPEGFGPGELLVRSPSVMHGYWNQPTDESIDPDGWLHTGDLARVDDGHLYITGRVKDVIIRGGENVSATHVESCLLTHPGVREAAVVGLPHPDLGEEIAAAVVLADDAVSAEDLATHCSRALGRFQVPTRWSLRTDPLPTNDAGKVVKHRIVADWAPSPSGRADEP